MTSNKNQHFVPRCHLRPFTLGSEDAAISLFNLERKKLIPNAPVKNQCSKDYFYGTDEKLEKAIQAIESGYGQALREVLHDSRSLTEGNNAYSGDRDRLFRSIVTGCAACKSCAAHIVGSQLRTAPKGGWIWLFWRSKRQFKKSGGGATGRKPAGAGQDAAPGKR